MNELSTGDSPKNWYEMVPYEEAKKIIGVNIKTMSRSFIAAGYYMKYVRDNELYKEDDYQSIWEFAEDQYGIKMSTASRWMAMNDKFSRYGNSPFIAEEFKAFGKSQLQEMLYLDDKQLQEARPEMSAKEIRAIRKPEEVSAYGTKKKVYPEGSLLTTTGCDGGHSCFTCSMKCSIRQEDRYCRYASMGKPFSCLTMNVLGNLRQEIGDKCQFINYELADHRAGDGEADPCCVKCDEPCGYACQRAVRRRYKVDQKNEEEEQLPGQMKVDDYPEILPENPESCEEESVAPAQIIEPLLPEEVSEQTMEDELDSDEIADETEEQPEEALELTEWNPIFLKDYLYEEEKNLADYLACDGLPVKMVLKQRALVEGIQLLLRKMETQDDDETSEETEEQIQPELPILKNKKQREDFICNYKSW